MNKDRFLFVISGPSGAGKGTVVKHLCSQHPEVELSVSATTRAPREGEEDGVSYHFVTREKFEQEIASGEILEFTEYCGNYYGTFKSAVDARTQANKSVILEIEVEGAANVKRLFPDCTTIFVMPPSMDELAQRLRGRGTESEEAIAKRLQRAKEEMRLKDAYDYCVVNETFTVCAETIYQIIKERRPLEG